MVPILSAGSGFTPYTGAGIHLRWDPAVFRPDSYDMTGSVISPNYCIYVPDADGAGAYLGCVVLGPTQIADVGLLATLVLKPVASGCSSLHLLTLGPPDWASEDVATYTITILNSPDNVVAESNTYGPDVTACGP